MSSIAARIQWTQLQEQTALAREDEETLNVITASALAGFPKAGQDPYFRQPVKIPG